MIRLEVIMASLNIPVISNWYLGFIIAQDNITYYYYGRSTLHANRYVTGSRPRSTTMYKYQYVTAVLNAHI